MTWSAKRRDGSFRRNRQLVAHRNEIALRRGGGKRYGSAVRLIDVLNGSALVDPLDVAAFGFQCVDVGSLERKNSRCEIDLAISHNRTAAVSSVQAEMVVALPHRPLPFDASILPFQECHCIDPFQVLKDHRQFPIAVLTEASRPTIVFGDKPAKSTPTFDFDE